MLTRDALRILDEHQAGILNYMIRAEQYVLRGPVAGARELAKARWQFARLLRGYQVFKHCELFDPTIRFGSSEQVQTAIQMKADCSRTGDSFTTYLREWSSADVPGRWDEYRSAMAAMIDRLRNHIATERSNIHRLFAGSTETRKLA